MTLFTVSPGWIYGMGGDGLCPQIERYTFSNWCHIANKHLREG